MTDKKNLAKTPLDYYHCTFFLPLIGLTDEDFSPPEEFYQYCSDSSGLSEAEKQAYHYFSPTLRDILFECGKQSSENKELGITPVREWRLPKKLVESWRLYLEPQEGADKPTYTDSIKTRFKEIRLFRYFNDIYILSFRVEAEDIATQPDLETWLHFTRLARLLYLSFPEQEYENKVAPLVIYDEKGNSLSREFDKASIEIPKQKGKNISQIVRFLLNNFSTHPNSRLNSALDDYKYLYDDRMFVSVAYGVAGEQLSPENLQRVLYLAAWVDRFADTWDGLDGYAYSLKSLQQFTEGKTLDSWDGMGGMFAFTDFSNAYVYRDANDYRYFSRFIAQHHIPYEYDRMLIQALFYQASLRFYDDEISQETSDLLDRNKVSDIRKQRGDFIRFTNQYWFHSLTNQMQGKRIFNLQMQGLELQKHYDIIKDELERTDEYLQVESNDRLNKSMTRLTMGGLIAALVGIYYTALPAYFDDNIPSDLIMFPLGLSLVTIFCWWYCSRKF